ncbi:MAG: TonB-dependent receptor [Bacteroidia bacterium]
MNLFSKIAMLLLVFSHSTLFGQTDSLKICKRIFKGHVFDGGTTRPLIGATVYFPALQLGTATNLKGEYKIENLCEGKYAVKISYLGYKNIETTIEIRTNTHLDFSLSADTSALESIMILGRKEDYFTVSQPVTSIEAKELDKTRGLALGEALKKIPGMFAFQTGPSISKPVLHGMHSNRLLIINAGLRQEGQQWGAEHGPEIDPSVSNKLTVIKGASGLRYGSDAIAGVIIVEPKSLKNIEGIGGEVNLGAFSNNRMGFGSAMVEGNTNKIPELKWRIQGSYKQAGSSMSPNYMLSNTAFKEDNFSLGLGYIKNKFEIDMYYSRFHTQLGILPDAQPTNLTDLTTAINRTQPRVIEPFTYNINRGYQNVTHDLVRVKASVNTGNFGKLSAILGSQWNSRQEYDRHAPSRDSLKNYPQYDLNLTTQSIDLVYDHFQSHHFSGQYGVFFQDQTHRRDGTRYLIPDYLSNSYGAFVMEKWKKNRVEVEAGIRYDIKKYHYFFRKGNVFSDSTYQYQNFSGNVGINYQLTPALTWKTNAGVTFRPPTPNEMFVDGQVHGSVFVEIGNSKFKAEQGYKFITNLEYRTQKLSFETSLYYTYILDYIYLRPTLLFRETRRGQLLEFAYTQTNASFYGIDLSAIYSITPQIDIIAKGSAVNAFNETFQNYLVYIPPYRGELAAKWQPIFAPFLKKNAVYGQVTGSFVANQSRVDLNSDFAAPPKGYALLALELGADIKMGKHTWFVSLQATNLLNTSYREYMNRYRYFADEPGRNFILRLKIPLNIYSPKSSLFTSNS